jgi:hypothetical protein
MLFAVDGQPNDSPALEIMTGVVGFGFGDAAYLDLHGDYRVSKFEATIKADSNRIFLPGNNLLVDLAGPRKKIAAIFELY